MRKESSNSNNELNPGEIRIVIHMNSRGFYDTIPAIQKEILDLLKPCGVTNISITEKAGELGWIDKDGKRI